MKEVHPALASGDGRAWKVHGEDLGVPTFNLNLNLKTSRLQRAPARHAPYEREQASSSSDKRGLQAYNEAQAALVKEKMEQIMTSAERMSIMTVEPTLESRKRIMEKIKEHVRKQKRKVYGGIAINEFIRLKDSAEAFYDESLDVPDIDFYSPDPVADMKAICLSLKDIGVNPVEGREAQHVDTFTIFANFWKCCDISYVPKIIYNRIPTDVLPDGLQYVRPSFMFIDFLRIINDPLMSYWRLDKNFPRFATLQKHYPLEAPVKEIADVRGAALQVFGSSPDKNRLVRAILKDFLPSSSAVIVGLTAFNALLEATEDKSVVVSAASAGHSGHGHDSKKASSGQAQAGGASPSSHDKGPDKTHDKTHDKTRSETHDKTQDKTHEKTHEKTSSDSRSQTHNQEKTAHNSAVLLELLTVEYAEDTRKLYDIVTSIVPGSIYEEFHPFYDFLGNRGHFLSPDGTQILLRVYDNKHKCVPFMQLPVAVPGDSQNKEYVQARVGTFTVIVMFLMIMRFRVRVENRSTALDALAVHMYDNMVSRMYRTRNAYLAQHGATILDETPFKEFVMPCVGEAMHALRVNQLMQDARFRKYHFRGIKYNPHKNPDLNVEDFKFMNTSGNIINSPRDRLFNAPDARASVSDVTTTEPSS